MTVMVCVLSQMDFNGELMMYAESRNLKTSTVKRYQSSFRELMVDLSDKEIDQQLALIHQVNGQSYSYADCRPLGTGGKEPYKTIIKNVIIPWLKSHDALIETLIQENQRLTNENQQLVQENRELRLPAIPRARVLPPHEERDVMDVPVVGPPQSVDPPVLHVNEGDFVPVLRRVIDSEQTGTTREIEMRQVEACHNVHKSFINDHILPKIIQEAGASDVHYNDTHHLGTTLSLREKCGDVNRHIVERCAREYERMDLSLAGDDSTNLVNESMLYYINRECQKRIVANGQHLFYIDIWSSRATDELHRLRLSKFKGYVLVCTSLPKGDSIDNLHNSGVYDMGNRAEQLDWDFLKDDIRAVRRSPDDRNEGFTIIDNECGQPLYLSYRRNKSWLYLLLFKFT